MESIIKLLGVALLCAVAVMLLRSVGGVSDMARGVSVIILSGAVLLLISPVLETVLGISEESDMGRYVTLMLKGVCITYLVHICASVCRDLGEQTIAGYVELIGKVEMIILTLPLIGEVVDIASQLIAMV